MTSYGEKEKMTIGIIGTQNFIFLFLSTSRPLNLPINLSTLLAQKKAQDKWTKGMIMINLSLLAVGGVMSTVFFFSCQILYSIFAPIANTSGTPHVPTKYRYK